MFRDEFNTIASMAKTKVEYLRNNPLGYLIASMLAGVYVGFGIMLIFSIGGLLTGAPYVKIVMGISFGIALSLVVMAGAELFTGNNLVMFAGLSLKTVDFGQVIKLWLFCFIGNWLGSALMAVVFFGAGLATEPVSGFIAVSAAAKMSVPLFPLFLRGMLCNILVCLAVWCGYRCKSESGKLIMIFWCLFAFITSGYEHSIANMSLLTVALLAPSGTAVSLGGYFYNIFVVTLGNMAGGILCVALPYYLVSKR